ncbi:NUDIX hydrolase [Halalkalibacter urbisdiaboli]|uniref:NUDIX hydrolase n=1 Tax=Halalkalibacter urbisdiaboli TaxID=1960589 RepID=UPI000B445A7E|nr:NUDIX hydrolase [Halalkalibacter urbisdiaboli]
MANVIFENKDRVIFQLNDTECFVKEKEPAAVAVLALHHGHILIVEQERTPVSDTTYELPGGGVEQGESIRLAAVRELQEETGYTTTTLYKLGMVYRCAYMTNEECHLYFAPDTTFLATKVDCDIKNVHLISLEDACTAVCTGEWKNSEIGHAMFLAMQKGYLPLIEMRDEKS